MTVGELIEELQQFNPKMEVWLSADAEGNYFTEAYSAQREHMLDDEVLAPEDVSDYEGDPLLTTKIVIWP